MHADLEALRHIVFEIELASPRRNDRVSRAPLAGRFDQNPVVQIGPVTKERRVLEPERGLAWRERGLPDVRRNLRNVDVEDLRDRLFVRSRRTCELEACTGGDSVQRDVERAQPE